MTRPKFFWQAILFLTVGLGVSSRPLQASGGSSLLALSADGTLLACSNRDHGTLTVLDVVKRQKLQEISVGTHPEGISFLGASHRVAVAVYGEDRVRVWDCDLQQMVADIPVWDEPYGVAATRDGDRLYVTLDYPGRIVEVDTNAHAVLREMPVGRFTRGVALTADERHILVTEYYTGDVLAIDRLTGKEVGRSKGISNDNLARQVVVHPRRPKAYLAHIRSRVTAVHGEGSIFPYVSVVDTRDLPPAQQANAGDPPVEMKRRRLPMDAFRGALVTANPWECALAPDGKTLVVVFAGTDDLFVCDVLDDDYRELSYRAYARTGKNPRAVCFSADGKQFFVYNALDFAMDVFQTETVEKIATLSVCEPFSNEAKLRGKILFYSALQPMASRRWISCASCHPDGQPDGRTWHNPEGLRNTQSLAGMAWTHPIHWSADRDEVQDFEHTIRGKLMQGRGLFIGEPHAELAAPNSGNSDDLDALAVYSNSHAWSLSPYARDGLSPAAQRGREIFESSATRCRECHRGPLYTDSTPKRPFVRHNVGTGELPGERLGPEFDTPTLLGVYRTAPYLHHGQAATLRDVFTSFNAADQHGATSHLTPAQLDDLTEYLQALPYEDPATAARDAGLQEIMQ